MSLSRRRRVRLARNTYRLGHAFLVTMVCRDRVPWFGRHAALADACQRVLVALVAERQGDAYAWCVMPDHVHVLVRDQDVVEWVRRCKGRVVAAARSLDLPQRLWQRSFHDHALRADEPLLDVAQYVWNNPVRDGLVRQAADYPYSGSTTWPTWREDTRPAGAA